MRAAVLVLAGHRSCTLSPTRPAGLSTPPTAGYRRETLMLDAASVRRQAISSNVSVEDVLREAAADAHRSASVGSMAVGGQRENFGGVLVELLVQVVHRFIVAA